MIVLYRQLKSLVTVTDIATDKPFDRTIGTIKTIKRLKE